jgi:phosphoglycerate-specific signal transduction histidine kinase
MADQLQVIQEQVTTLTRTVEYVQVDMQTLKGEVGDIKQELKSLREGQIALRTDMAGLTAGFEQMDKRFGDFSTQVDKRFGDFSTQVDKRFGDFSTQVDKRFGDFSAQVDRRFEDFSTQIEKRFGDFSVQVDRRFEDFSTQVDKRLGDFSAQVDKRFGDLGARVTSVENWLRWGVGILLLSWLTLMTSIWLK